MISIPNKPIYELWPKMNLPSGVVGVQAPLSDIPLLCKCRGVSKIRRRQEERSL